MNGTDTRFWIAGRPIPEHEVAAPEIAASGAATPTCYSAARIETGHVRWIRHHVRRLERDARRLGLGALDPEDCESAFRSLAAQNGEAAIAIIEILRTSRGELCIAGRRISLGSDPPEWRAVIAPIPHPDPDPNAGVKLAHNPVILAARERAREAGVDEALVCDRAGQLVEGSRSNLLVVGRDGVVATPPDASGAVAGIARELALHANPEIRRQPLPRKSLDDARELIALNAVRGARPIVRVGGEPLADGRPGPWAQRIAEQLAKIS